MDSLSGSEAVHQRHVEIHQNQVVIIVSRHFEGLYSVVSPRNIVGWNKVGLKKLMEHQNVNLFVVGDQHFQILEPSFNVEIFRQITLD